MREGWIKDYRQETESDIWMMPPLYLRVWQYLKYAVCFEEKCIPMRDGSFVTLAPGQHLTSIRIIADKVSWFEGGINRLPNPKTIMDVLEWMVKQDMISIDTGNKKRQYTLVTIVNWDKYQSGLEEYDNSRNIDEKQELDIKNNYNNEQEEKEQKEEKEEVISIGMPEKQTIYSLEFEEFWKAYPKKIEKMKAYKNFVDRIEEGIAVKDMITAAANYATHCRKNDINVKYIKYPTTFLSKAGGYEEFVNYIQKIKTEKNYSKNVSTALQYVENTSWEVGNIW